MSIYYYGKFVSEFAENPKKQTEVQQPTLVGDIVKNRPEYKKFIEHQVPKKKFVIRHYQEGVMS